MTKYKNILKSIVDEQTKGPGDKKKTDSAVARDGQVSQQKQPQSRSPFQDVGSGGGSVGAGTAAQPQVGPEPNKKEDEYEKDIETMAMPMFLQAKSPLGKKVVAAFGQDQEPPEPEEPEEERGEEGEENPERRDEVSEGVADFVKKVWKNLKTIALDKDQPSDEMVKRSIQLFKKYGGSEDAVESALQHEFPKEQNAVDTLIYALKKTAPTYPKLMAAGIMGEGTFLWAYKTHNGQYSVKAIREEPGLNSPVTLQITNHSTGKGFREIYPNEKKARERWFDIHRDNLGYIREANLAEAGTKNFEVNAVGDGWSYSSIVNAANQQAAEKQFMQDPRFRRTARQNKQSIKDVELLTTPIKVGAWVKGAGGVKQKPGTSRAAYQKRWTNEAQEPHSLSHGGNTRVTANPTHTDIGRGQLTQQELDIIDSRWKEMLAFAQRAFKSKPHSVAVHAIEKRLERRYNISNENSGKVAAVISSALKQDKSPESHAYQKVHPKTSQGAISQGSGYIPMRYPPYHKVGAVKLGEIVMEATAGEEAKRRGLKSIGFGRYADPQTGKVVAKSEKGRLVAVKPTKEPKVGKPSKAQFGKVDTPTQKHYGAAKGGETRRKKGSLWRGKQGQIMAKNQIGYVQSFNDEETAQKFAKTHIPPEDLAATSGTQAAAATEKIRQWTDLLSAVDKKIADLKSDTTQLTPAAKKQRVAAIRDLIVNKKKLQKLLGGLGKSRIKGTEEFPVD